MTNRAKQPPLTQDELAQLRHRLAVAPRNDRRLLVIAIFVVVVVTILGMNLDNRGAADRGTCRAVDKIESTLIGLRQMSYTARPKTPPAGFNAAEKADFYAQLSRAYTSLQATKQALAPKGCS